MKTSGFLKRKTPMKRGTVALKRSKLRLQGHSTSAQLKREIQATLRAAVILRDGGCVLRMYPEAGPCSGPLQGEHLNSRTHMHTFADLRNLVCLCQRHHIFWKPQNSRHYWELIEEVIGVERWRFLKLAEADHSPHKVDLKLALVVLQQELKALSPTLSTQ